MSSKPSPLFKKVGIVPRDIDTSKRLFDQHTVATQALGGHLVLAPIDLDHSCVKILDSGTADGEFLCFS